MKSDKASGIYGIQAELLNAELTSAVNIMFILLIQFGQMIKFQTNGQRVLL